MVSSIIQSTWYKNDEINNKNNTNCNTDCYVFGYIFMAFTIGTVFGIILSDVFKRHYSIRSLSSSSSSSSILQRLFMIMNRISTIFQRRFPHEKSHLKLQQQQETQNADCINDEYQVLKEAIQLLEEHFFDTITTTGTHKNDYETQHRQKEFSPTKDKVVNYLSPEDMIRKYFLRLDSSSSSLNHYGNRIQNPHDYHSLSLSHSIREIYTNPSPILPHDNASTTTTTITNNHTKYSRSKSMINLLKIIQQNSVNTNHPYFFNQLFGSLDPIALSAELIALSVNTSSYTYETAPVFTMIEREVIHRLGCLVFDGSCDDNTGSNITTSPPCQLKYDGLMLPGGSLSNLTAIHVARYFCQSNWRRLLSHQQQLQTKMVEKSTFNSSSIGEEKKEDDLFIRYDALQHNISINHTDNSINSNSYTTSSTVDSREDPILVAFVSSEAHYSFAKAISVTGIGIENLIVVPTLANGQMDASQLDQLMSQVIHEGSRSRRKRIPFFVAATLGSTVRGSFDDINAIVRVCRKHEESINDCYNFHTSIIPSSSGDCNKYLEKPYRIWIHVDGAWGGSAIFSNRPDLRNLLSGLENVDSFTFNPHKMLGAPQQTTAFISRHNSILKSSNSTGAKYLFDSRKHGAEFDLGDASYTCGRRTDSIKLWALWKYYGCKGLGKKVEDKVDILSDFAKAIRDHDSFMLACDPWPFNINFYYLPKRIRQMLAYHSVDTSSHTPIIPDDIASELAQVSVELKLILHQSGEMLIPYQPLNNQKADCFRLVLAGNKKFDSTDIHNLMNLMEKYGESL